MPEKEYGLRVTYKRHFVQNGLPLQEYTICKDEHAALNGIATINMNPNLYDEVESAEIVSRPVGEWSKSWHTIYSDDGAELVGVLTERQARDCLVSQGFYAVDNLGNTLEYNQETNELEWHIAGKDYT
jgi:hypothetical protein